MILRAYRSLLTKLIFLCHKSLPFIVTHRLNGKAVVWAYHDQTHPIGGTGAHITRVPTAQIHSPIQFC